MTMKRYVSDYIPVNRVSAMTMRTAGPAATTSAHCATFLISRWMHLQSSGSQAPFSYASFEITSRVIKSLVTGVHMYIFLPQHIEVLYKIQNNGTLDRLVCKNSKNTWSTCFRLQRCLRRSKRQQRRGAVTCIRFDSSMGSRRMEFSWDRDKDYNFLRRRYPDPSKFAVKNRVNLLSRGDLGKPSFNDAVDRRPQSQSASNRLTLCKVLLMSHLRR